MTYLSMMVISGATIMAAEAAATASVARRGSRFLVFHSRFGVAASGFSAGSWTRAGVLMSGMVLLIAWEVGGMAPGGDVGVERKTERLAWRERRK